MNTRRKIVYLPMEFSARELYSKVLIATKLASKGIKAVIGQQWMMHALLPHVPPGIVLFKSYHKTYWPAMTLARDGDHYISALEEELFSTHTESGVSPLVSEELGHLLDTVYVQSMAERNVLLQRTQELVLIETGNPRADLMKPRLRNLWKGGIDKIKNKYGKYLLINTNFGITNSAWGSINAAVNAAQQSGVYNPSDSISKNFFESAILYENFCKNIIIESLPLLQGIGFDNLIIRPHPNENLAFWQEAAFGMQYVHVVLEGPHVPWTLGADCLVHGGCATGFESRIGGVQTIAIALQGNLYSDSLVSNYLSRRVHSLSELLEDCARMFSSGLPMPVLEGAGINGLCARDDNADRIAENMRATLGDAEGVNTTDLLRLFAAAKFKQVPQLSRKCDLPFASFCKVIRDIAEVLQLGRMEVTELGPSLYAVEQAGLVGPYRKGIVIGNPGRLTIAKILQEANARGKADVQASLSEYRDSFRRSPEAQMVLASQYYVQQKFRECYEYCLQAENLTGGLNFEFSKIKMLSAYRTGDLSAAKAAGRNILRRWPYVENVSLARKVGLTASAVLVVGDSNSRYFRNIGPECVRGVENIAVVEVLEIGGATAFGLLHEESQSGGRRQIEKAFGKVEQCDCLVFNFGEIDCRRAAWRYAIDSGVGIEQSLKEAARAYVHFVHSVADRAPDIKIIVLSPKPALLSTKVAWEIAKYDLRSVANSLEDRQRATAFFSEAVVSRLDRINVEFMRYADYFDVSVDGEQFQRMALNAVMEDDIHGSLAFFRPAARRIVEAIISKRVSAC